MKVHIGEDQQDITESDLGDLQRQLKEAVSALNEAAANESQSRSRATDARNSLNRIQKKIDGVIEGLRQAAPPDTDWARPRVLREAV